jgi:hypothetical protein
MNNDLSRLKQKYDPDGARLDAVVERLADSKDFWDLIEKYTRLELNLAGPWIDGALFRAELALAIQYADESIDRDNESREVEHEEYDPTDAWEAGGA